MVGGYRRRLRGRPRARGCHRVDASSVSDRARSRGALPSLERSPGPRGAGRDPSSPAPRRRVPRGGPAVRPRAGLARARRLARGLRRTVRAPGATRQLRRPDQGLAGVPSTRRPRARGAAIRHRRGLDRAGPVPPHRSVSGRRARPEPHARCLPGRLSDGTGRWLGTVRPHLSHGLRVQPAVARNGLGDR